jgi:hypothetical protein
MSVASITGSNAMIILNRQNNFERKKSERNPNKRRRENRSIEECPKRQSNTCPPFRLAARKQPTFTKSSIFPLPWIPFSYPKEAIIHQKQPNTFHLPWIPFSRLKAANVHQRQPNTFHLPWISFSHAKAAIVHQDHDLYLRKLSI